MNPTPERIRELFSYNPETGELHHRLTRGGCIAGALAGWKDTKGWRTQVDGKHYYVARLAWAHAKGRWPAHQIDHINCDRFDNRLCNLREATGSQNQANKPRQRNNTTGFKGVFLDPRNGHYYSVISVNRARIRLGAFGTALEAHSAYEDAARKYFGEFARGE